MRNKWVFLLIACLILVGIPNPSNSEINSKTNGSTHSRRAHKLTTDSKIALRNLENQNSNLLTLRAGEEQRPVNSPEWDKNKPGGGISDQAAVGIVLGGLILAGIIFVTTAANKGGC